MCVKELGSVFGDTLEFCVADDGAIFPDRVNGHLPSMKGCEGFQINWRGWAMSEMPLSQGNDLDMFTLRRKIVFSNTKLCIT